MVQLERIILGFNKVRQMEKKICISFSRFQDVPSSAYDIHFLWTESDSTLPSYGYVTIGLISP